jgi:hypothetical protein
MRVRRGQGTHVVLLVTCWWIAFVLIYNYAVLPRAREVTDGIQMVDGPIDYGPNTEVGFRSGCRLRNTEPFRKYQYANMTGRCGEVRNGARGRASCWRRRGSSRPSRSRSAARVAPGRVCH